MQTAYNNDKSIYAGFFVRLAAFLLDMLFVNILLLFIKLPVWCIKLALGDTLLFTSVLFSYNIFDILYYLMTVGYFILATYFCGTTLGKYLMKIKVISADGSHLSFMSVLIRETVGRYLSAIILYIGYMIAGWDTEKQGLHDRIADTYVVYRDVTAKRKQSVQPVTVPVVSRPAGTEQSELSIRTAPVMPTVKYVSSNLGEDDKK